MFASRLKKSANLEKLFNHLAFAMFLFSFEVHLDSRISSFSNSPVQWYFQSMGRDLNMGCKGSKTGSRRGDPNTSVVYFTN